MRGCVPSELTSSGSRTRRDLYPEGRRTDRNRSDQSLGPFGDLIVIRFEQLFHIGGGIRQSTVRGAQQECEDDDGRGDHQEFVPPTLMGEYQRRVCEWNHESSFNRSVPRRVEPRHGPMQWVMVQQVHLMGLCMAMDSPRREIDDLPRDDPRIAGGEHALRGAVAEVIEDVRPGILADGGDVELVSVDGTSGIVTVRLTGACVGCPSATITMKFGIERIMLDRLPWVTAVQQVEDHEIPDWAEY